MDSFVLTFHCTVCEGDYFGKEEWLSHLRDEYHQVKGRQKLISDRHDGKTIKKFVVVYAKSPAGKEDHDRLLQHFSKEIGTIVTDFVWFPERMKMGFMEFESRKKIAEVLDDLDNRQVVLEDKHFQLRAATDVLPFEWDMLLPVSEDETSQKKAERVKRTRFDVVSPPEAQSDSARHSSKSTEKSKKSATIATMANEKRSSSARSPEAVPPALAASQISGQPSTSSGSRGAPPPPHVNRYADSDSDEESSVNDKIHEDKTATAKSVDSISTQIDFITMNGNCKYDQQVLKRSLNLIIVEMEVPDEEYRSVLQFIEVLTKHLVSQARKTDTIRVFLTRCWALKLKYINHENHIPSICVATRTHHGEFIDTSNMSIEYYLSNRNARSTFPGLSQISPANTKYECLRRFFLQYELHDWMEANRILEFKIAGHNRVVEQSHTWRLLTYLSKFDPRCWPLLAVTYYWSTHGSVKTAYFQVRRDHGNLLRLTLLVILYMGIEGHIPTSKIILKTRGREKEFHYRVNVGFMEDQAFLEKWLKEKSVNKNAKDFPLQVFTLASQFFIKFGEMLKNGNWIIIYETGEIVKKELILADSDSDYSSCSLDREDNALLKKTALRYMQKYGRIYMSHPLYLGWTIEFSDEPSAFEDMIAVGRKLEQFIQKCKTSENCQPENLLDILKM